MKNSVRTKVRSILRGKTAPMASARGQEIGTHRRLNDKARGAAG